MTVFLTGRVAVNLGSIKSLKQVHGRKLQWPQWGEDRLCWWVSWPCISYISLFLQSCDSKGGRIGVFNLLWIICVLKNHKGPTVKLLKPMCRSTSSNGQVTSQTRSARNLEGVIQPPAPCKAPHLSPCTVKVRNLEIYSLGSTNSCWLSNWHVGNLTCWQTSFVLLEAFLEIQAPTGTWLSFIFCVITKPWPLMASWGSCDLKVQKLTVALSRCTLLSCSPCWIGAFSLPLHDPESPIFCLSLQNLPIHRVSEQRKGTRKSSSTFLESTAASSPEDASRSSAQILAVLGHMADMSSCGTYNL